MNGIGPPVITYLTRRCWTHLLFRDIHGLEVRNKEAKAVWMEDGHWGLLALCQPLENALPPSGRRCRALSECTDVCTNSHSHLCEGSICVVLPEGSGED